MATIQPYPHNIRQASKLFKPLNSKMNFSFTSLIKSIIKQEVQKALQSRPEHKRTKGFKRFQSDQFKRIATSWRKPKGIDNPLRRHYRGRGPMPNIGYGTNKKTRFYDSNGFVRYVVNNEAELEVLLMHNHKYQAVIGQAVGARKRIKLLERARELDIRVVNARGKLKTEEKE